MSNTTIRILSAAEQVADHLKEELSKGVWTVKMPGGAALSRELGVGRMTVDAALELLEKEGLLIPQGAGRSRLISQSAKVAGSLRVGILPFLTDDFRLDYVMEIQRLLQAEGNTVIFSGKSIDEMGSSVTKVAKLVKEVNADAWIVVAGPKDVLSWFVESSIPAFALFGRRRGLPIASIGPDKENAYRLMVRHLVGLGHRRICMLDRPLRRLPSLGAPELAFLDELEILGVKTSSYNLPDWDGKVDSLGGLLASLWRYTPPSVLIVGEPPLFFSAQLHLARLGILAPKHVSLVCADGDPYFEMLRPSIAHIRWDSRPWVRRVVRWVNSVAHGKFGVQQSLTNAEFITGGSIGSISD